MTTSRHISQPMRPRRGRSTADRILSAGLATATCVGIVGVIGVRSMEQSAAAQQDGSSASSTVDVAQPATTSAGLTEAQLDTYAAQLAAESAKLDAYRTKLQHLAKNLRKTPAAAPAAASAPATASAPAKVTKPKPVAKPAPKPAPKPVAKPAPAKKQSNTKSS